MSLLSVLLVKASTGRRAMPYCRQGSARKTETPLQPSGLCTQSNQHPLPTRPPSHWLMSSLKTA